MLKTPITYYGGKQRLASRIIKMIPEHRLYCEPFFGGGAVFFQKPKSEIEVINDKDDRVVIFYKVLKENFGILRSYVHATPHSRSVHRRSESVLKNYKNHNEIEVAWAFWVQTNMSFGGQLFAGYGYGKQKNENLRFLNKKKRFDKSLLNRLEMIDIECNDALKVIASRDTEHSFFYVDPPYFNSNMGHYGGYTEDDFRALLAMLSAVKGKFLLSSYPSEILGCFTEKNGWYSMSINQTITVSKARGGKIEVLTANYPIG